MVLTVRRVTCVSMSLTALQVFTATRHHAEFLQLLVREVGLDSSIIYGAMDQEARKVTGVSCCCCAAQRISHLQRLHTHQLLLRVLFSAHPVCRKQLFLSKKATRALLCRLLCRLHCPAGGCYVDVPSRHG